MSLMEIAGFGSRSASPRYGSADPDPYQNVTDPQYFLVVLLVDGRIRIRDPDPYK